MTAYCKTSFVTAALIFVGSAICQAQNIDRVNNRTSFSPIVKVAPRMGLCSALAASKDPLSRIGIKAYSQPISEMEFQFQTTSQDGDPLTIQVQEGAMGKVISYNQSKGYAFIPVASKVDSSSVDIHLYNLTVDPKGNESISEIGTFVAKQGELASLPAVPEFQIRLLKIVIPDSSRIGGAFGTSIQAAYADVSKN